MISLHSLPKTVTKHRKRLGKGEGSRRGKNAGAGHKGQVKRSGKMPVYFATGASDAGTSILARNPKIRGFKKRENKQAASLPLIRIINACEPKAVVTLELLKEKKLISSSVSSVRVYKSNVEAQNVSITFDKSSNIYLTKGVEALVK